MKYLFSVITFLIFASSIVLTAEVSEATEALKNKQYDKAISLYQAVLDDGKSSGEIHYNLGIAYAELEQIGYAIWHFQLAERAGLSSDNLYHNLKLVKEERIDEIEVIPEFFLSKWWDVWKNFLSSNIWSILALILIFGGTYVFYTWRTAEDRSRRKMGFAYGVSLILLSTVCFLSAFSLSADHSNPSQGVLLTKTLDLKSAPDAESTEIITIHEGVDIDVQDRIGEWYKVRLENGQIGWLPVEEVGLF